MIDSERKGRLKSWNDGKGFGFVRPASGGSDVFVHISAMRGERRPEVGDEVLYVEGRDERGRPRAEHLRLAGELSLDRPAIRRKPKSQAQGGPGKRASERGRHSEAAAPIRHLGMKTLLFLLLCGLPLAGGLHLLRSGVPWIVPLYLLASLVSFLQYWLDKRSAQAGSRRTAENTLHLLELAGGWPGALIAQQLFRHKTRKVSYQAVFWLIVALHQLLWVDLLVLDGAYIAGHLPLLIQ